MFRIKNTDTVSLRGQAATSTKETTNKISDAILEKCTGMTAVITKGNGLMGYSMEKELCLCQDKAQKRVFLEIIYLSRFTNSSRHFLLLHK